MFDPFRQVTLGQVNQDHFVVLNLAPGASSEHAA
jgi:hypothetical protein